MKIKERIDCGHAIEWRWKSVGQDGAFCKECVRVYPVRRVYPMPRRVRVAAWVRRLADRIEG